MRRSRAAPGASPPWLIPRALILRALLPRRRVREGQLGVARLVDLDYQRHTALRASHRARLPAVLVRHGIHDLELEVGTALHHAAAELHLLVRSAKIPDGQRYPGDAARVAPVLCPNR